MLLVALPAASERGRGENCQNTAANWHRTEENTYTMMCYDENKAKDWLAAWVLVGWLVLVGMCFQPLPTPSKNKQWYVDIDIQHSSASLFLARFQVRSRSWFKTLKGYF
jgi:hypothetical protein